jgi:hypothetical protein
MREQTADLGIKAGQQGGIQAPTGDSVREMLLILAWFGTP